jgi:hypothetical protein
MKNSYVSFYHTRPHIYSYLAIFFGGGGESQGAPPSVLIPVEMMEKFFDVLSVSNFTEGKHKRKPFQNPYTILIRISDSK